MLVTAANTAACLVGSNTHTHTMYNYVYIIIFSQYIQGGGEDGVTWSIRDGIYRLFVIMTQMWARLWQLVCMNHNNYGKLQSTLHTLSSLQYVCVSQL